MRSILVSILFLIAFSGGYALAHPVIYKGGWVYQGSFMPQMNEMRIGYTFHPNFSVVANSNRFENNKNYQDYSLGVNVLAKRWLQHDSQGNIYFGAHVGQYEDDAGDGFVGHGMVMADWEDREDYVLFRSKSYIYDGDNTQDFMFRYGFAPFVAGMNTLQSWFIVQLYYYEQQSKNVLITPMLRFFYKNVLWEMGSSTKGDTFLTLMVHY